MPHFRSKCRTRPTGNPPAFDNHATHWDAVGRCGLRPHTWGIGPMLGRDIPIVRGLSAIDAGMMR